MENFLRKNLAKLKEHFFPTYPSFTHAPIVPSVDPVTVKVLVITHNPSLPTQGNRKLSQVFEWQDPTMLVEGYRHDLLQVSHGYANFQIIETIEVDDFPLKKDGFRYTKDSFSEVWRTKGPFHKPDGVDYVRLLEEFSVFDRVNDGSIDEVWLMGMPYAGYWESLMVGPGAFWCNSSPLEDRRANRRFVVMGFNYERGVGEMLENMGHRTESIMSHVWRNSPDSANLWKKYIRYDKTHPSQAECGNVHFAPNSERDYDWGNPKFVNSYCDDWLDFPNFKGVSRQVNCAEWGNGDIRHHHQWWLGHLPHVEGQTYSISNNWWEYIVDPNKVH